MKNNEERNVYEMKLYIKEKVFTWGDKFTVTDELGRDRYIIEGEIFSWGKKLHVYDMAGNEAAFIQQKLWTFRPKYQVFIGDEQIAEIIKEISFFKSYYTVEGLGWEVEGSFWDHDYEITRNGCPIVRLHKEWMTWGDCYELDIADSADEIVALAVVVTIDCIAEASNN
ncbi:MAG: hypothetical protein E7487_08300 [Ruminococcaceae bacterium]|nr:hypothetical protein [Oscillospiraceae bacterium]